MKITKIVQNLTPYVPGEQPKDKDVIKLNTNENPYPPSPACREVLKNFDLDKLRRYPDPIFMDLRAAIATRFGTTPAHVFVGNGSDEILSLVMKAFVENDECVGSLDPSYSLYQTLADIRGVPWKPLAMNLDEATVPANMAMAFITNPNAPTGIVKDPAEIARFSARFPGVVLIDEAYADFAPCNCMALATAVKNTNILVMRTFSKSYSLAGLRVGFCVGPEDLIDALYRIKDSYNVDAVAQAVALAAFNDTACLADHVSRVKATRERFIADLRARGWDAPESGSNFVFVKPPAPHNAVDIFNALRERHIYVRYFSAEKTRARLRITIGTDEQMASLLSALDDLIQG